MSILTRLFDILPWRRQKEIIDYQDRSWEEVRRAFRDLIKAIFHPVKTDSSTGWTRIHEKIKSETLRFFNIDWIHWRWILGNNRSCMK